MASLSSHTYIEFDMELPSSAGVEVRTISLLVDHRFIFSPPFIPACIG